MSELPKGPGGAIKPLLELTYNRDVRSKVGDYAGVLRFNGSNLVSSTDGVGTKLTLACEVAHETGNYDVHEVIGEDLVNHCVNDILVVGARPLFFLNTFSYSDDRAAGVQQPLTRGMARAALQVGMPLISGETSKMEGFYPWPDRAYDVVGTIVGSVPDECLIHPGLVQKGDKLIGLASNGLHTNGFTLLRHVFCPKQEPGNAPYWKDRPVPGLEASVREEALKSHRCYYGLVVPLLERYPISGIAHVTGGGIEKNLQRVIGQHKAEIDWPFEKWPRIFQFIKEAGRCTEPYMRETYNLGIGMVLVVPPYQCEGVTEHLTLLREKWHPLGTVV